MISFSVTAPDQGGSWEFIKAAKVEWLGDKVGRLHCFIWKHLVALLHTKGKRHGEHMPQLPLIPHPPRYRGRKPEQQARNIENLRRAQLIADHANRMIADNPQERQTLSFGTIAIELRVPKEQVWDALSDGGSNGLTFRITVEDRLALEKYRTVKILSL